MNAVDLAIRVTSDARNAGAGLDQTTAKASKMGKVGAAAGKALAVGLAAAAVGAFKLAQGAADDQASAAALANTLKTVTGATDAQVKATEGWISAQGKALGIADDQLRPALTSLATATKDVQKAQDLASLAMDISAKRGKSLQSVSDALAKAYTTGNVAALAKYGVAVKNADGSTKSLEQVTSALSKTYKGSAATAADTVTGKWQRAQLQLSELGEAIGYKLIPAMEKASAVGLQAVDWVEKNQTTVGVLVVALGSLMAITFAVSKAMQAWAAISKVITVAQWALNVALNANPVSLIVLGVVALAAALVVAYKRSETFRKIVDTVFGAVQKVVGKTVDFIKNHWQLVLGILTGPFGLAIAKIIQHRDKILAAIGKAVDWIKNHWQVVLGILTGPFGLAIAKIIQHREAILDKVGSAIQWIKTHWNVLTSVLSSPFDTAAAAAQKVADKVQGIIDKIQSIPTPKLPDLNPLNRQARGTKADMLAGGSTASSSSIEQLLTLLIALLSRPTANVQALDVNTMVKLLRRHGYIVGKAA